MEILYLANNEKPFFLNSQFVRNLVFFSYEEARFGTYTLYSIWDPFTMMQRQYTYVCNVHKNLKFEPERQTA